MLIKITWICSFWCLTIWQSFGQPSAYTKSSIMVDPKAELMQIKTMLLSESNLDSIVERVINKSYDLMSSKSKIAAVDEEVKLEKKSWMRSFTLGVNLLGYNLTPAQAEQGSVTQLSMMSNAQATLLISPYDLLSRRNRIERARHMRSMYVHDLDNKRRELKIFIVKKFLSYQEALETFIICENNLMISEEIKQLADDRFRQARISTEEYNLAISSVMKYRTDLLKAESAAMKYKYELEILMSE